MGPMESASDMQLVTRGEFKSEMRCVRDEVSQFRSESETSFESLRATDKRLAMEIVKMRSEMADKDDIRDIRAGIESLKGLVIESGERGRMYDQKALSHGHQLMEHEASIRGHEKRISKLEGNA